MMADESPGAGWRRGSGGADLGGGGTALARQYTAEDLGDDYRGGMASFELLSQTSFDSADITDSYGPTSGSFRGYTAADMANESNDDSDPFGGGGAMASASPVGRRGSLQLSIPDQGAWLSALAREGWEELYDTTSGQVSYCEFRLKWPLSLLFSIENTAI